jgi:hypothetical protein
LECTSVTMSKVYWRRPVNTSEGVPIFFTRSSEAFW